MLSCKSPHIACLPAAPRLSVRAADAPLRSTLSAQVLLSDSTDKAEIKIVDLGFSRFFGERNLMSTICGTHTYVAPELVQCSRGLIHGYDKAVDMWGVGLLAFIMMFGFNPFARESQMQTYDTILKCDWNFPDGFSVTDDAKAFIRQLLRESPTERPTAVEALKSTWLSPEMPSPPRALMSSDESRSVKQMLWVRARTALRVRKSP